jgi:ataxia telangiectasia mutated family protein
VEAIVDHITQVLPEPKKAEGYFEPLAQNYIRALCSLFEHQANVERLKPTIWQQVITFCLDGIDQYVEESETEPSGLAHSFSGLVANHGSSSLANPFKSGASSVTRQNAEDLLSTLLSLVSAPGAPLLPSSDSIVETVFRFLHSQGSAVSAVYQLTFSILNTVLSFCREDSSSILQNGGQQAVPIICRFWQGKASAKDEMRNSVKDEMLIFLFTVHLHLERSIMDDVNSDILAKVADLADTMRAEYVKRSDRDQLLLEDIEFTGLGGTTSELTPFHLATFRLRAHNTRAERNWANLKVIGLLERLVSVGYDLKRLANTAGEDSDKHLRKRQRVDQHSDRLLSPIKSEDENIRLAGLQILPFVLHDCQLSASTFDDLVIYLSTCASDRRGHIASWALLAIAR